MSFTITKPIGVNESFSCIFLHKSDHPYILAKHVKIKHHKCRTNLCFLKFPTLQWHSNILAVDIIFITDLKAWNIGPL